MTKKTCKKNIAEKHFLSFEINLFFFGMFFYPTKLTFFFLNWQQSYVRNGQRKTHCFFGNAQPKSKARAHLKQKKNIVHDTN